MGRKVFWVLFFLTTSLLLPASSFAQFTQVTATVTDPNGYPYSYGTVTAVLTPATPGGYRLGGQPYSGFLGLTALDSTGTFTANMGDVSQITPSGAQWLFTIGSSGIAPPQGFGAQSFTYTSTGTQITGSSVNLSTSISAAAPAIGRSTSSASAGGVGGGSSVVLSPNCPKSNANNCFNTPADARRVFDASWTNAQTTVTCPNSDCNFLATDTGTACWGVQTSGVYTFGNTLGTFTYISAQSGTCVASTNAVGTETATGKFVWGHNDTANMVAAITALYALPHCGTLSLPSARLILASGWGANPSAPASCNIVTSGYYQGSAEGFSIVGVSRLSSIILLAPGFDFTQCVAGSCFPNSTAGTSFRDFTIDGMNASLSGISTAPASTLWRIGGFTGGQVENVYVIGWAYSASNSPQGLLFVGQSIPTINVENYNFGKQQGRGTCGANTAMIAHYAGGGLDVPNATTCIDFDGAYTTNVSGVDGIAIQGATSILDAFGTYSQESSSGSDSIAVTGTVHCYSCQFGVAGAPNATYQAIKMTGGNFYTMNGSFDGGATSGVISGTTGTVFNEGGNTTPGTHPFTYTGSYVDLTGTFTGAGCTGVASPSATLGFYGTGPNVTATTCTSVTIGSGIRINRAAHIYELLATATAGGVNASSGLVTVLKNGASQTMVCTIGTGTSCSDGTVAHFVTLAAGDLISVNFTTQAAETLAGVQVSLIIW
jgi:hypothetical protein